MTEFITGVDDIATMNAHCAGWSIVSFSKDSFSVFDVKAKAILNESGLKSFHGNDFKRKKAKYYTEFLHLIRETLESSSGFACCTLLGQDWKSEFELFCSRVINSSFEGSGVVSSEIIEASKALASPLFTYQRIANNKCNGGSTLIYIDRDSILDKLNSENLLINGQTISSQLPIVAALRAYGRERFPNAPEIARESIYVTQDEESLIVQAADIFGNFSTALVFQRLGKDTVTNNLKCQIFNEVFDDIVSMAEIPAGITSNGEDLKLEANVGSFTFCIG